MMSPVRSVALPTTAGHQVQFRNGVAAINDTNDLPYLLGREDVKLEINEYAMSWMHDVLARTTRIRAEVHWPAGYAVSHRGPQDFDIADHTKTEEPPVDPLDSAIKAKKPWPKPPSNSSAS